MSTPRRTRLPPWYHRIRPSTWILLWLLLTAAIASLAMHAVSRRNTLPRLVQVQVWNGSGVEGMAQHAAQRLRARGLDVVSTGDADASDYARTLVLQRRGSLGVGRQVAKALGMGEVVQQFDPTLLVDVTVVLGRDYARREMR